MRIIGHLDMDCFFAAVEERDHEWLRGLPIVVGADPQDGRGRGVVSTANYKAREYGIHSAMPISEAWRLTETAKKLGSPAAFFVRPNFDRYSNASSNVMAAIRSLVPAVEEASIDEAYMDLSFVETYPAAAKLADILKEAIRRSEKLTASIGIGPNRLIAKIASDIRKPDGLTVVEERSVEAFLEPLPIRKIPGIGPKTEAFFRARGAQTVRDLKKFSKEQLNEMLGKWGLDLYEKIRGRDLTPMGEEHEVKSIGEQETFLKDTLDPNLILERLKGLCESVGERIPNDGFRTFRTVVVTVRFADFETKSRSHTLPAPVKTTSSIHFEALKLLMPFFDRRENPQQKAIRLIGIRVEKLS